jgi:hypothetical protein
MLAQQEHIQVIEKRLWKAVDALRVQARDMLSPRLLVNWEVTA